MVKKSSSIAAAQKKAPAHARLARSIPRARKTSEPPLDRKRRIPVLEKSNSKRRVNSKTTIEKDFVFYANPMLALVCVPSGTSAHFSLDEAVNLTGVHAEMLRYYSRVGLIESHRGFLETDLFFDEEALREVRRIVHYRQLLGIGLRALPLICELRRASERLQIELRFLSVP